MADFGLFFAFLSKSPHRVRREAHSLAVLLDVDVCHVSMTSVASRRCFTSSLSRSGTPHVKECVASAGACTARPKEPIPVIDVTFRPKDPWEDCWEPSREEHHTCSIVSWQANTALHPTVPEHPNTNLHTTTEPFSLWVQPILTNRDPHTAYSSVPRQTTSDTTQWRELRTMVDPCP